MKNMLKMSLLVLFHPCTAFGYIQKTRDNFKWYPVFILLAVGVGARLFELQFTHYPLSSTTFRTNLFYECCTLFVPLISFAVASYLMTSIMDGETQFRESFLASAYSVVPYVLITIPLTLVSHIMDANSSGLYTALQAAAIGWMILLIVISVKEMNHFTIGRTLGVIILAVCTVVILWCAVALVYTICMQFMQFVGEIAIELRYRF